MSYKESYWSNVDVQDTKSCWLWRGRTDKNGRPRFKGQFAYRLSLALSGILLDNRLDVHHTCNNERCCSPYHLMLMTHSDHSRQTRSEH